MRPNNAYPPRIHIHKQRESARLFQDTADGGRTNPAKDTSLFATCRKQQGRLGSNCTQLCGFQSAMRPANVDFSPRVDWWIVIVGRGQYEKLKGVTVPLTCPSRWWHHNPLAGEIKR